MNPPPEAEFRFLLPPATEKNPFAMKIKPLCLVNPKNQLPGIKDNTNAAADLFVMIMKIHN